MSPIKWIGIGVLISLALALAVSLYWNHHQTISNTQNKIELETAKLSINELDTSIKVNDDITSKTIKALKANAQIKEKILQQVDNTTKQVNNEEITTDAADAAYIDSMWNTYCTYNHCTTRQHVN